MPHDGKKEASLNRIRPRKPSSLTGYWTGIQKSINGRLDSVQDYLRHPSSGFNAENYFRDLLAEYLPHRYAVESGFVVNVNGDRSDFIDVLIVDMGCSILSRTLTLFPCLSG